MTTILRLFGLVAISIAVAGCHEQPKKVSDMSAREQQRLRDQLRDDAEVHACASSGVPRLDKNETLVDDRIKIWVRQKTPKLLHHIEDKYGKGNVSVTEGCFVEGNRRRREPGRTLLPWGQAIEVSTPTLHGLVVSGAASNLGKPCGTEVPEYTDVRASANETPYTITIKLSGIEDDSQLASWSSYSTCMGISRAYHQFVPLRESVGTRKLIDGSCTERCNASPTETRAITGRVFRISRKPE